MMQRNVEAVLAGMDGVPIDEIDARLEERGCEKIIFYEMHLAAMQGVFLLVCPPGTLKRKSDISDDTF